MTKSATNATRWSSKTAAYLSVIGASVGLGSIWRFPYLAGTGGGSAFILVFVLACVLVAIPLLAAELAIGRQSRASPPQAGRVVARQHGAGSWWASIGVLGTIAVVLILSTYTVVAGLFLAYTWKCVTGELAAAGPQGVAGLWQAFAASPYQIGAWHAAFMLAVALISASGVTRGVELVNKVRAPALLGLMLLLVVYSLYNGDVHRAFVFAFAPRPQAIDSSVVLSAIGQAFYATGVGSAIMIAYGSYIERDVSLLRTTVLTCLAVLVVSVLATILIFPLAFAYGVDPAQGFQLVFQVLPRIFVEMPGGRIVGTLFFLLLVLAALTPSIASMEPAVAWLVEQRGVRRSRAAIIVAIGIWALGLGSVLSLNVWSQWHPIAFVRMNTLDLLDFVAVSVLLPVGALLTSFLVGWRIGKPFIAAAFQEQGSLVRAALLWLLRVVCPAALILVGVASLV